MNFSSNHKMYDDVPWNVSGIYRKSLKSTLKKSLARNNNRQV